MVACEGTLCLPHLTNSLDVQGTTSSFVNIFFPEANTSLSSIIRQNKSKLEKNSYHFFSFEGAGAIVWFPFWDRVGLTAD